MTSLPRETSSMIAQWLWHLAAGPMLEDEIPVVEAAFWWRQNAKPPMCSAMCCEMCMLKNPRWSEVIWEATYWVPHFPQDVKLDTHMQESKDGTDVCQSKLAFTMWSLGKVKNVTFRIWVSTTTWRHLRHAESCLSLQMRLIKQLSLCQAQAFKLQEHITYAAKMNSSPDVTW